MSADPYLGEIATTSFNFAPKGWALCNGQLLSIAQNQALFALLGTTYGGNGQTTFALPDLRGRVPMHTNFANFNLGNSGGEETHSLNTAEIPAHTHALNAANVAATVQAPTNNQLATAQNNVYSNVQSSAVLASQAIAPTGQGIAHNNMQPSLTLNFIIALQGIFPSRN